jgi:hypothetical protein
LNNSVQERTIKIVTTINQAGDEMLNDLLKPTPPDPRGFRVTLRETRWLLLLISALVLFAGVQLYVLSDFTAQFFAWTAKPAATAAFLGAMYLSSFPLAFSAAQSRYWSQTRLAVLGTSPFSVLTLLATLLHLGQFHLESFFGWSWLAVYAVVTPLLLGVIVLQLRAPGGDPPRVSPLAPWVRIVLGIQAVVLLGYSILLFLAPETFATLWVWSMGPLAARAVAAWLVGLGAMALEVILENDWGRIRPVTVTFMLFALLQFGVLLRYPETINWSAPTMPLYLLLMLSILGFGVYGWIAGQRAVQRVSVPDAFVVASGD